MTRILCLSVAAAMAVAVLTSSTQAATIRITIDNLTYVPAEASARVGDTVEWINKDVFAHTATARNHDFDVMQPPKSTVSTVLKKAGTVDYFCKFHPNMKGRLVIAP